MELLERGAAYRCYMTVEELAAERETARAEGRADPLALARPRRRRPATNQPFVVRLRAPLEGETVVDDLVKGPVAFRNRELDDLILLRADGSPTYNLAVVVDDHDMGVTHVIRGDDHLNNAAAPDPDLPGRWAGTLPAFAHLPMIHGPDGAKLSKRHGAQAVREFADMGYLPEAMRNYLARLGWGHGDDEIFSDAQAIAWFDIVDVVSAPARLDWAKLDHVNHHYIRAADDARLLALVARGPAQPRRSHLPADFAARLARTIPLVKEGAKTMLELADLTLFALKPRPLDARRQGRRPAHRRDAGAARAARRGARRRAPTGRRRRWHERAEGVRRSRGRRLGQIRPGAARRPGRRRGRARPRQRPCRARAGREPRAASTMLFRKCSKPL